jgi:uncharacterized cupin superfamily protein
MNKINLAGVPIVTSRSPKGRFRRLSQNISRALGGSNGLGAVSFTQPYEVELVRMPAGAVNWPYHSHSGKWELYLVISGRGQVRTPEGTSDIREGDCILHAPGEPHQIINTGASDLVYHVIANNVHGNICHYPDSNKWSLPNQTNPVRVKPADLYEGEE